MNNIIKVLKGTFFLKRELTVVQTLNAGVALSSVDLMAHLLNSSRYILLQKCTEWN